MKNVTSLKSSNNESPKTPGGISKSLLTPCRRVGLSRNWRKSGPSPFVSPLSSSTEVTEEKKESRKRKERAVVNKNDISDNLSDENVSTDNIDKTPSRNVEIPRRKKSKTLISSINKSKDDIAPPSEINNENISDANNVTELESSSKQNIDLVSTPVRTKSRNTKKLVSPIKTTPDIKKDRILEETKEELEQNIVVTTPVQTKYKKIKKDSSPKITSEQTKIENSKEIINSSPIDTKNEEAIYKIKEKSPNDLGKECIVVIQRKIFKNIKKDETTSNETSNSDSEEEPLINLHKENSSKLKSVSDDEEDFIKPNKTKNKPITMKLNKTKPIKPTEKIITQSSRECFDDDDDDFDDKKTILIKKTYNKVNKPVKSKSTGSITQRDIDKLRERIEVKKKLLLAQSLTPDTEELRNLIKKWQKGCQDALMELLDLMRTKFADKERMDYSDMLKTLKIPPSLVGYDSENDCFNSPDDASIILGQFKDI